MGVRADRALQWRDTDHLFVGEQSPSCRYVIPELGNTRSVRSLYNSGSLTVVGSLPPFADIRTIPIAEGRFYNWDDHAAGRRVAVLGSDAKKQLFASREAVGETIDITGLPYTVIGVMKPKDQDSSYDGADVQKIFIPFSVVVQDFPNKPPALPHSIDRLLVQPKGDDDHDDCKWQVRRALAHLYDFDPHDKEAASIWDTYEETKAFRAMTNGMKYFLGAVGLVSLFLGGIGVMNVMLVAVKERTKEIGVRKAVGASTRVVLRQFFIETLIVVFLSGGIGMGIAYGLCAVVNSLPMPMYFAGLMPSWQSATLSFGLLGTIALLSALYPASRAASVDPIVALRYESGG